MKNKVDVKTHKDLLVWKKAIDFITVLYRETACFASDEKFGITNQMRRAVISIPSNIAEGAARNSNKEFVRFLYIALGSAAELETQIIAARNLKFLNDKSFDLLIKERDEIGRMIYGLIKYKQKQLKA